MLGITDIFNILANLDFTFDRTKIITDNDYIIVEVKGIFNRYRKLTPMQLDMCNSILSPNYKIRIVRKIYKWTLWTQEIIGGTYPWMYKN